MAIAYATSRIPSSNPATCVLRSTSSFQMLQATLRTVSRRVKPVLYPPGSRPISTSIQEDDPTRYCRAMVQKHDYEGFLMSFAYGNHTRDAYFALKALNVSSISTRRRSSWKILTVANDGPWADGASDDSGQYFTTRYCSDEVPMVEGHRQGCLSSAFSLRFGFGLITESELIHPRAVHQSSLLRWLCVNLRSQSGYRNTICRGLSMQG